MSKKIPYWETTGHKLTLNTDDQNYEKGKKRFFFPLNRTKKTA